MIVVDLNRRIGRPQAYIPLRMGSYPKSTDIWLEYNWLVLRRMVDRCQLLATGN